MLNKMSNRGIIRTEDKAYDNRLLSMIFEDRQIFSFCFFTIVNGLNFNKAKTKKKQNLSQVQILLVFFLSECQLAASPTAMLVNWI